ncbi:MAG TPA: ATP-binding protein [Burkholderiales bacterium]|nr:ATP-binding protein [Burkholderiales bacterium]
MSLDSLTPLEAPHARLAAALSASARISIALAVACLAAALFGSAVSLDVLQRFVPGWPAVKPVSAIATLLTAAAFALLLSTNARKRAAGLLLLFVDALATLAAMLLPEARHLPGGALEVYPGSVLLLIIAAIALGTAPGTRQLAATRLLAAAGAALLLIALIGISYRLLLSLPPLVDISLPTLIALLLLTYAAATARPDQWLLERLTTNRPGAVITRRLLPAVLVLPLVIGWLEVAGEAAGVLDAAFGAVLQTVFTIFGIGALVLWGAHMLDRLEARRSEAEEALRGAYAELDKRVEDRTAALERANAALRDAQRFTQGLVETAPIVLYLFDQEQKRIVYGSGTGLDALGYTPADLTSRDRAGLDALIHPEDLPRLIDALRREPLPEGAREVEFRCRARSGEWRWMHARERSFEQDEPRRLLLGVMVDITDRKNAELERERLMAAEQRLRVEAERANRAKDEFLAIVSHELRSPLNALRGWGFLLGSAKSPDPGLIERATQAIKRNVDHQARLIEDLLDTSRIMSGKLNIERRPVNLVEVMQGALETIKQSSAAKRIAVEFTAERPAIMLEGDTARLHQIAVNLLSNAVKFTGEGGAVTVRVGAESGLARVTVSDTGAGIAPEFLPHVFDRFSQADTSTTRRHGGLGIGLALVRHLTELHGGTVRALSSGAGKGSTFVVELPLPQVLRAPLEPVPGERSAAAEAGSLAGATICALDDDPDARDVISLTLRQAGAEVRTVASGAELIAVLDKELPAYRPDVLLMDLAMPDEDGFTVLARVRALEARKALPREQSVPAIAVTAFTEVSRDRVIEQGFIDHVSKPIDPARLVATIRRAMLAPQRGTGAASATAAGPA